MACCSLSLVCFCVCSIIYSPSSVPAWFCTRLLVLLCYNSVVGLVVLFLSYLPDCGFGIIGWIVRMSVFFAGLTGCQSVCCE